MNETGPNVKMSHLGSRLVCQCLGGAKGSLSLVFRAVFVQFFHLHPAVLEPDFDLSLGEVKEPRHLVPAIARKVRVKEKLFLQLQDLVFSVRASFFARGARVKPVGHGVVWINVRFIGLLVSCIRRPDVHRVRVRTAAREVLMLESSLGAGQRTIGVTEKLMFGRVMVMDGR